MNELDAQAEMSLKMAKTFARVLLISRMIGPELLTLNKVEVGKELDKAFTIAELIIQRSVNTAPEEF